MAVPLPDGGLQAERTALAWSRTCFGVVANAVILMVVPSGGTLDAPSLICGSVALGAAALAYGVGARRRRVFRGWPLPVSLAAPREIAAVSWVIVLLAVTAGVTLVL